ncbi:MAG: HYR domain-containing protein, partial [Bacteroidia bacterium]
VLDQVAPVAVCQNVTVSVTGNGSATVSAGQVNNGSSDNCGIANISVAPNSFGCANVGANNTVVLTVTDLSGNSSTCSANVTVNESIAPTALCQNLTVQLDGNGQASITAAQVNNGSSDNCGIQNLSVSPSTFNCSNVVTGANSIAELFISEYIEGSGNNKCVEIFNGTSAAVNLSGYQLQFYFNGSNTANTTINLTGTVAAGDVFVVCSSNAGTTFTAQADQLSGASFYNGDDAIVLVHNSVNIDVFGRIGEDPGTGWTVSGNQTLDRTLVRNSSVSVGNTANASGFPSLGTEWTQFATDYTGSLGSHSVSTGSPVVTLTVTDVNGNTATCNATVTVQDNVAPVITCPANISVNTDLGVCGAAVSHAATATDNCSATVSQTSGLASGAVFPVGTSSVSYNAVDPSGNSASCSFTVTVTDNEAPVISCPENITVNNDNGVCGAVVSHSTSATDNCSATVSQASGLASGATFPVGTSSVSYSAVDPSGNTAACSFTVTVVDAEAPVAHCQDVTVQLDNAGNGSTTASAVDNGSTDNCGIASVTLNPSSFTCANVGANAATLTVTDIYGNASTCGATVTVQDNVAPVAVCQDVTVTAPTNGSVSITASQVDNGSNDACGIANLSVNPNSFACTAQGPNTVTLTVVDVNGNSSTCTATVTVNPTAITVSLSSPVDGCGYNVSRCCTSGTGGSGSGSGSGHEGSGSGSGSGNGDHGSGSGSSNDGSGYSGSSTGNHGNHGNCRISNCSGNGHSHNGSHGHGNCGGGNLGGGHGHGNGGSGNIGSGHGGHGHGGCGSGNTGNSNCGHDGSPSTSPPAAAAAAT